MPGEDHTTDRERPLTILTVITPARYSGAERVAVYLADGLQRRGHRVVFACKHNEQLLEALARRDIEAHPLSISGKGNLMAPFLLAWFAESIGADVIHTHLSTASLWGAVAGKITGIPSLASVHALNIKTCFQFSDRLTACSEGVRQHLIGQGIPPERIEVLYNGLNPELFDDIPSRERVRQELDIPQAAPVVGEVAHLSPRKGQVYLLEAVALLLKRWPKLVCLLLGEGEDRDELQRQIERLGIGHAVRMMGYRADARRIIQAMDVVVLPSVAIEGFGMALIEGAFLGKPVVGSDAPGIREAVVDGATGLLAPPADAVALAEKLNTLLEDPDYAQQLGAAGRERAWKLFTLDQMATHAETIYWTLLRQQGICRVNVE